MVFVSKDENLTKVPGKCLESRLLSEATKVNRFTIEQSQAGGAKLPESDRQDMQVFLDRIRQLPPVLGSGPLTPIAHPPVKPPPGGQLIANGTLVEKNGSLVFTEDADLPSPSAGASAIAGGWVESRGNPSGTGARMEPG